MVRKRVFIYRTQNYENHDDIRPAVMGEEFEVSMQVLKHNRALEVDNLNGELLVVFERTENEGLYFSVS